MQNTGIRNAIFAFQFSQCGFIAMTKRKRGILVPKQKQRRKISFKASYLTLTCNMLVEIGVTLGDCFRLSDIPEYFG